MVVILEVVNNLLKIRHKNDKIKIYRLSNRAIIKIDIYKKEDTKIKVDRSVS